MTGARSACPSPPRMPSTLPLWVRCASAEADPAIQRRLGRAVRSMPIPRPPRASGTSWAGLTSTTGIDPRHGSADSSEHAYRPGSPSRPKPRTAGSRSGPPTNEATRSAGSRPACCRREPLTCNATTGRAAVDTPACRSLQPSWEFTHMPMSDRPNLVSVCPEGLLVLFAYSASSRSVTGMNSTSALGLRVMSYSRRSRM